jgi:hypothetical protein
MVRTRLAADVGEVSARIPIDIGAPEPTIEPEDPSGRADTDAEVTDEDTNECFSEPPS